MPWWSCCSPPALSELLAAALLLAFGCHHTQLLHTGVRMPARWPPICACPLNLRRFLQPGLLLKGVNLLYDDSNIPAGQPRKSWIMRSWQQREAVADGLAEWQVRVRQGTLGHGLARSAPCACGRGTWPGWLAVAAMADRTCPSSRCLRSPPTPQANPYFAAGRVTVPALQDTFTCQSFFNEVRGSCGFKACKWTVGGRGLFQRHWCSACGW